MGDTAEHAPGSPTETRLAVLVATGVWTVLFAISLVFDGTLRDDGRGWWTWTALAGALIGVAGLAVLRPRGDVSEP